MCVCFLSLVPLLLSADIIKHVLPLHNADDLAYLRKHWVQAIFKYQPLGRCFSSHYY